MYLICHLYKIAISIIDYYSDYDNYSMENNYDCTAEYIKPVKLRYVCLLYNYLELLYYDLSN